MAFKDSEFSDSEDFFLDKETLDKKIRECFSIIDRGESFLHAELLEDTIEQCIDNFRFKDGLRITNALLKIAAFDSDQWFNKGYCLAHMKKYQNALNAYNKARSLNPHDIELLVETASVEILLGKFEDAENTLNAALELSEDKSQIYIRFGRLHERKGDHKTAIDFFTKAMKLDPQNPDPYFQIAICYENMGSYKKSLGYYEKYLNLDPECDIGWFNKAIIYEKLKLFEHAIDSYEFALALNNEFYDAWFNYANLLADLERYQDAIEAFQQVIKIVPKDESAFYNIAAIYEDIGQLQNAIHFYSKAIEIDSGYQDAYLNRGYCYTKLGFHSLAIDDLRSALEFNYATDVQWDIRIGNKRIVDEKDVELERTLKLKVEANPDDLPSLIELAEAQLRLMHIKDALHSINNALKFKSARMFCYYLLAQLYFMMSQNEKAVYYLGVAIQDSEKIRRRFFNDFPIVANSRLFPELFGANL